MLGCPNYVPEVSSGIVNLSKWKHSHDSQPVLFKCQWIATYYWEQDLAMVVAHPDFVFLVFFMVFLFFLQSFLFWKLFELKILECNSKSKQFTKVGTLELLAVSKYNLLVPSKTRSYYQNCTLTPNQFLIFYHVFCSQVL